MGVEVLGIQDTHLQTPGTRARHYPGPHDNISVPRASHDSHLTSVSPLPHSMPSSTNQRPLCQHQSHTTRPSLTWLSLFFRQFGSCLEMSTFHCLCQLYTPRIRCEQSTPGVLSPPQYSALAVLNIQLSLPAPILTTILSTSEH